MEFKLCVFVFAGCFVGNIIAIAPGKLVHTLLANYDKIVLPDAGEGNAVNVSHSITLLRVNSLEDQTLTLNSWIEMHWKDSRLTWNPESFDNIKKVRIPSRLLWLPDIVLFNSADEIQGSFGDDLNAFVQYNGDITYVPPAKLRSNCEFKSKTMKRHHKVTCQLKFGSWTYDASTVDMYSPKGDIDLSLYTPNLIWKLGVTSAVREVRKYDCCPEEYTSVIYSLTFKYKDD